MDFNEMTPHQVERVSRDYSRIAGEPVRIEIIGGSLYAFGSELACLRMKQKMPGRAAHSQNRQSWYFNLEPWSTQNTQLEQANAIDKIRGYYLPRPHEEATGQADAFDRAKAECLDALGRQIKSIERVDAAQFSKGRTPAAYRPGDRSEQFSHALIDVAQEASVALEKGASHPAGKELAERLAFHAAMLERCMEEAILPSARVQRAPEM